MSEELKVIAEALSNLGEHGTQAFMFWVVFSYLKTLTIVGGFVFVFATLFRRVGAAIYNAVRVKCDDR